MSEATRTIEAAADQLAAFGFVAVQMRAGSARGEALNAEAAGVLAERLDVAVGALGAALLLLLQRTGDLELLGVYEAALDQMQAALERLADAEQRAQSARVAEQMGVEDVR